jgi:hypothetical protein
MLRSLRGKKGKAERPPKPSKDDAKRLHARFHQQLWEVRAIAYRTLFLTLFLPLLPHPPDHLRPLLSRLHPAQAQNSPAPTADFSACGLDTLSAEALAACYTKHTLLLHSNFLSLLPPALSRLGTTLRVLDLHNNYLTALDPAVGTLKQLQVRRMWPGPAVGFPFMATLDVRPARCQVLNLQHNFLDALPEEIGSLPNLQSLNLQENGLQALPASICSLSRLRTLNLQDNNLQRLPPGFWQLRALVRSRPHGAAPPVPRCVQESIPVVDCTTAACVLARAQETLVVVGNPDLSGISPDVLAQGTDAIMRMLCHGTRLMLHAQAVLPAAARGWAADPNWFWNPAC